MIWVALNVATCALAAEGHGPSRRARDRKLDTGWFEPQNDVAAASRSQDDREFLLLPSSGAVGSCAHSSVSAQGDSGGTAGPQRWAEAASVVSFLFV